MKRVLTIICALMITAAAMAEQAWKNENLKYGMYLGPIKAGDAQLVTENITYNGQKAVRMRLIARTTSTADKLFSLNDTLTTIVRPEDSSPIFFQKHCFEGDDIVREKVNFSKTDDGKCHAYMDPAATEAIREKYRHPFWKVAGEIAKKVGGHGGMDFIMDLRWSYCLQNGLPLDTDVYDLAAWSAMVELTETSVDRGSRPVDCPDFTRGAWQTAKPFAVDVIDLTLLPDGIGNAKQDEHAIKNAKQEGLKS